MKEITDGELREAIERMRGDIELNGKTRVLEHIEHFTGIELKALWTDIARAAMLVDIFNLRA